MDSLCCDAAENFFGGFEVLGLSIQTFLGSSYSYIAVLTDTDLLLLVAACFLALVLVTAFFCALSCDTSMWSCGTSMWSCDLAGSLLGSFPTSKSEMMDKFPSCKDTENIALEAATRSHCIRGGCSIYWIALEVGGCCIALEEAVLH